MMGGASSLRSALSVRGVLALFLILDERQADLHLVKVYTSIELTENLAIWLLFEELGSKRLPHFECLFPAG